MRYFIYISDAKVDMVLPQVPGKLRQKIAAEIGFNLGLIEGKLSAETKTLDNRVGRLRVAEKYIRDTEEIGSARAPAKWIEDSMPMFSADVGEGALLFIGEGDSWILALAGSSTHLAGGAAPKTVEIPFSFMPSISSHLARLTIDQPAKLDDVPEKIPERYLAAGVDQGVIAWYQAIVWSCQHEHPPVQNVTFLAKRLADQAYGDCRILLATPLYIEVTD